MKSKTKKSNDKKDFISKANEFYLKALTKYQKGEYQKANNYAEKALKLNNKDERIFFLLSLISERNNDLPVSVDLIEEGLKIEKGNIFHRERAIKIYMFLSCKDLALKHLKYLVDKFPQHINSITWSKLAVSIGGKVDEPKRNYDSCLIVPELLSEVDLLLSGQLSPTTATLYAFDTLIEAIVFHDILYIQKGIFKHSTGELGLIPTSEEDLANIGKSYIESDLKNAPKI